MMVLMAKDRLFLIRPGFEDPNRPGKTFVCPYCNQIEGLLGAFPDLAARIEVVRVGFPRPRADVIAVVGEENQSLPLLVFADEAPEDAGRAGSLSFIQDTRRILDFLAERHGFPSLH
ncbi:DUF3088 domain-containing protein [Rhizobium straminoryzae]|uniref:DUF3088 domain-containing protein n=1 Tax=Rhizobium straminoryzae TaxID=1387186 RepID=A0A549T3L1_9HYPH|nr:DUF3088 domain-containing protein [Rhizobium straminoryzae]TRL36461.1 DUF3088 domain-containing protein [Rhizobium straminoryzae]